MRRPLSRYEKAERSLRRLRSWRNMGTAANLLMLLVLFVNGLPRLLADVDRDIIFDCPWGLAGASGLVAGWMVMHVLEAAAARRLAHAEEPEQVGSVALLLGAPPRARRRPSRRQTGLVGSLTCILPRVGCGDIVYLENDAAEVLYDWITPAIGLRAPVFVQAILGAIRTTRDGRALPFLQRYCVNAREEISEPAITCEVAALCALAECWAMEKPTTDGLLRPAEAPAQAGVLLRPVEGVPAVPSEHLLRAGEGPASGCDDV